MPRLVLAAVAALLVVVPAAHAAPLAAVAPVDGLRAGPALGDGVVVWAAGDAEQRSLTVRSAPLAGGAATTLFAQRRPTRGDELLATGIAATPTRVALGVIETLAVDPDGATAYQVVRTGRAGGPLAVTAGDPAGTTLVRSFDLSGDLLATVETSNSGSGAKAYVRDLAAGGAPRQYGPAEIGLVQVAGSYVAVSLPVPLRGTSATIVVYDRASGDEVYRVSAPITPPYAYGFGFDLAPDGTLAILTADPRSTGSAPVDDLAWASMAEPSIHVLATGVSERVLRIVGRNVLFARARGPYATELALADLGGGTRAVSFPVGDLQGADFDGAHVALATSTCIYAGDVPADGAPAQPPLGTCPQMAIRLELAGTPTTRTVKARITCTMGPATGCAGTARLVSDPPKGGRRVTAGVARFAVPAGARRTITINISRRALTALRRSIRHNKRARMIVRAVAVDAAGLKASDRRSFLLRIRR